MTPAQKRKLSLAVNRGAIRLVLDQVIRGRTNRRALVQSQLEAKEEKPS